MIDNWQKLLDGERDELRAHLEDEGDNMDIGTRGFWRHELRGGYGWIEHVPAVLLKVGPKRLGLAVQKRSGQWVPKWVKPDHFIVKEQ